MRLRDLKSRPLHLSLSVACLLLAFPTGPQARASEDPWPGFRGAQVDGTARGSGLLAGRQAVALETAWKVPLGSGYSGVAVAGDLVITMASDETNDQVVAFAAETGRRLWTFDLGPTYQGHDGSHTGPLSTPLIGRYTCLRSLGSGAPHVTPSGGRYARLDG